MHRLGVYAVAAVLARLADEGARVVRTLLALDRAGSAAHGGLLIAALLVPHVVAAPLVGLLADRSRRPTLLIAIGPGVFGASLAFAAIWLGRLPTAWVAVVLLLGGSCGPALTGGLSSRLADLCHRHDWRAPSASTR